MFVLSDPNLGEFDLDDLANGVLLTEKDFGFPTIREVVDNYPDNHGVVDNTTFFGDRVISIQGVIVNRGGNNRTATLNRIRSYCLPYARPTLKFNYDGGTTIMQTKLRVAEQTLPITNSSHFAFTMQWKVQPFFKGDNYSASAGMIANNAPGTNIWTSPFFPIVFDHVIGDSVTMFNNGLVETWPVLTLFGPVDDPIISNATTGKVFHLQGLHLNGAPDFVRIDMMNKTVLFNDTESYATKINYDVSTWWPLLPGQNQITLNGSNPGVDAQVLVQWNDLYL